MAATGRGGSGAGAGSARAERGGGLRAGVAAGVAALSGAVAAAAGAIYACPIATCGRLEDGLATLQGAGFVAIGLDAGASGSLFDLEPPHRAIFVLGSESSGLSPGVSALLDRRVAIPMHPAVESLNVAVAAGLVCYHARHLPTPASRR